jgi:hypothetical protein
MFNRNITIVFLTEDNQPEKLIDVYNNYVDYMLVWLYIVDLYASKSCSPDLKIFVYHTSLLKNLPLSNIDILNENNVNTAFTRTCPVDSEIVIFRKEEWFKVFMHETFHNFGLDFSGMNIDVEISNKKILEIFPVNSDVNLFEAYTEFWARIMNVSFCSFVNMVDKDDINEFLRNVKILINFENSFAFFQMVKVLDFMGLSYKNLYYKKTDMMRKTLYKEHTNVLSYYVITLILLNNYEDFLLWCDKNNIEIMNFNKTLNNLFDFCKFIKKRYNTHDMLEGVICGEKLLKNIKKLKDKKCIYILNNLRMSICEMV